MQAAQLTDPSTLTLQINTVNNTCTVTSVNQGDALKLGQLHQITYEQHEFTTTAYITPPDGSVRGVITNAYWNESPHELLANLIASSPHETILDTRRMRLTRSVLITFGPATVPRRIVYDRRLHLCPPYTPSVVTCSNSRTTRKRTDVYIQYRSHKCPRCGELHPKEANPKCTPVGIICEGPHLPGSRECKHQHLPKIPRPTLECEARFKRRVDHTIPDSGAQGREELLAFEADTPRAPIDLHGPDKLKTPKGTSILVANTPPFPDRRVLRALRLEISRLQHP
ncbi:hypothetical protein MRX96_018721 [Rhipicephalus microplus]